MSDLTVRIEGCDNDPHAMTLVAFIRRDKGYYDHPCHLFAYTGEGNPYKALLTATREYVNDTENAVTIAAFDGGYFTWGDLMGDADDYHATFAKHGLTEINLPMGMAGIIFDNNENILDY